MVAAVSNKVIVRFDTDELDLLNDDMFWKLAGIFIIAV
jgi:hypothetical protein